VATYDAGDVPAKLLRGKLSGKWSSAQAGHIAPVTVDTVVLSATEFRIDTFLTISTNVKRLTANVSIPVKKTVTTSYNHLVL